MLEQALVTTDTSKKYTEWPAYQTQSSDRTEPYHDNKPPSTAAATATDIQQYRVKESNKQASQARLRGLAQYTRKQATPAQRRPTQTYNRGVLTHNDKHNHEGSDIRDSAPACSELDSSTQSMMGEQRLGVRPGDRAQPSLALSAGPQYSSDIHHDMPHERGIIEHDNAKSKFSQKILSRAENLLSKVKKTTASFQNKGQAGSDKPLSNNTSSDDINSNFSAFVANSDQLSARLRNTLVGDIFPRKEGGGGSEGGGAGRGVRGDELEWLLRGVPEAYDDDVVIEDAVVDRLIKEGGAPPSQLHFPSLYATSQKTLLNLENAKMLSLTITELNIFSARFGVRKESSYLVIRCPTGCTVETGCVEDHTVVSGEDTQVVSMNLEAQDPWRQLNTKRQKNVLKDYFVGSKVLDLTVKWNISVNDALVADWLSPLNSTDPPPLSSMIHVDVYSYLLPSTAKKPSLGDSSSHANQKRGWSSSAILLGSTDISIQVLLASPSLSSFVSSEISLDQTSQATVADRLRRLPNYSQLGNASKQQNLTSLGNLKCKLSLLDACSRPLGPSTATSSSTPTSGGTMLHQTALAGAVSTGSHAAASTAAAAGDTRLLTVVDEALNFVPHEVKVSQSSDTAAAASGFPFASSALALSWGGGGGGAKAVSVGIAVHSLTRGDWSGPWLANIPTKGILKLLVSYKIALSHERYDQFDV